MAQENQNELEILTKENQAYWEQLTKRNEQYMNSLDKALIAANVSELKRAQTYNEMLKALVEGQRSGQTARRLYGTVTERTDVLLGEPAAIQTGRSENWKIMLDGGLLMGSLFALITGVSGTFGTEAGTGSEMGLITLILNYIVGGFVVLKIVDNVPDKENPKKGGMLRYILIATAGMLAWMFLMTASMAFIPTSINILLPSAFCLAIGIAGVLAKMYLKRKLDIRGGIF